MHNLRHNNHRNPAEIKQRKALTLKQQSNNIFQENLKIYLRLKPLLQTSHGSECIKIINRKEVEIIPGSFVSEAERVFSYQEVFEPSTTNFQVFNSAILDTIANVLSGFNSTVFIYGMTGAGKTFTMFNPTQQNQEQQGIVEFTLAKLFEEIQADRANQYQLRLSFFEIYNENIRDLLSQHKEPLVLLEDPLQGVIISELKEISVDSQMAARQCIQQGINRRVREATKNNQASSRSHALLQFTLRKITHLQDNEYSVQQSKLFLIDLAGNQKASQNQNKRFIEGVNINKSLLTLGKCISILSQNKKNAFIPYRDSKLTRILKDSLGGNSKTVMIACISTESRFYEETLNTLKYSSKAKQIKNKGNGGIVRKIKIEEIPIMVDEQSSMTLEQEERIFSFVNSMESILSQKIKTQSIQEQLQLCLHDQQVQSRLSPLKLKEVRNTLGKIREKYKHIVLSLQEQIQFFVGVIRSFKKGKRSSDRQIETLKKEVSKQKELIAQLQRNNHGSLLKCESQSEFKSERGFSVFPVCLSQPEANQEHQNSIHEKFHKNQSKKNPTSIKIESCRNSNKQNVTFNIMKRSHTSHSSIKIQKVKAEPKQMKPLSKPVIDITKQNFKLQSPTMKEPILIRSDSSDSNSLVVGFTGQNRLEYFLSRLKQLDRFSSTVDSIAITTLLLEYEREGYEVGRLEKSMLSKLRFMMKSRPKTSKQQTIAVKSVQV